MTKPVIQIGNQTREMTDAEYDQYQIDVKQIAAEKAAQKAKEKLRIEAINKLGLTADEIAAVFG